MFGVCDQQKGSGMSTKSDALYSAPAERRQRQCSEEDHPVFLRALQMCPTG